MFVVSGCCGCTPSVVMNDGGSLSLSGSCDHASEEVAGALRNCIGVLIERSSFIVFSVIGSASLVSEFIIFHVVPDDVVVLWK